MNPLARDTTPAAEARQIAIFQQRLPRERLALMCEFTAFAVASSRAAIRRAHPELDVLAQAKLFLTLQYGASVATRIHQPPTIEGVMSIPAALLPVARALTRLHIPYYVGGSIASTAYSLPRSTYDIDIAADIQLSHVSQLVAALVDDFYIDHSMVIDAIAHRDQEASFNITHYASGINIDIFVTAGRSFDHSRYQRAQPHEFPGVAETVKLASAEDIVLNKLMWFRQNGIESDKQWRDVAAIIRVQGAALDLHYLRIWAAQLSIGELLDAALRGEPPPPADPSPMQQGRLF